MDAPEGMEISEAEAMQLAMTRAALPDQKLLWAWNENGEKEIMQITGTLIATGELWIKNPERVQPMDQESPRDLPLSRAMAFSELM